MSRIRQNPCSPELRAQLLFLQMKLSQIWSRGGQPERSNAAPASCPSACSCPLNAVRAGMQVRIKELSAPDDVTKRLREIGFCEQQVIKLLFQQTSVICLVCNARVAISSDLARMIMVEPVRV